MNHPSPKVSVIVPVYNVGQYISRCLDSLLNQTLQEIEIICIDDQSPDNSGEILDQYSKKDYRVRVIHKTQNQGPMVARKDGYSQATGEYLFFCDGDDFLPADALESLYEAAQLSGADMVIGNMQMASVNGPGVRRRNFAKFNDDWKSYLRYILNWGTASLCGIIFKWELFEGIDYTYINGMKQSEDRRLLTEILLSKHPRIYRLDKVVYYYWINPNSTTHQHYSDEIVRRQFESLYGSYDYIESRTREFTRYNDNQMLLFLSMYIESGVSPKLLKSLHPHNRELLKLGTMVRTSGTLKATHLWLCIYLPGYKRVMHSVRKIIRKFQGKG